MKKLLITGFAVLTMLNGNTFAQTDSTGLPGDNFDLEGALSLFQQSNSLKDFERKLNTESYHVNNLDLDQNGKIDYIRVIDNQSGDNHAIQLQIPVSVSEQQDVAAILVEKTGNGEAKLQMIGDASLYGQEKIIDPVDEQAGKQVVGPSSLNFPTTFVYVNVWYWPCIQYMYGPRYSIWISPYYWGYYPSWWYPWTPVYWNTYYTWMSPYHGWCNYTNVYRVPHAHQVYMNHHVQSPMVYNRYAPQRQHYTAANHNLAKQTVGQTSRVKTPVSNQEKVGTSAPRSKTMENRQNPGVTARQTQQPVMRSSGATRTTVGNTPRPTPQPQVQPRVNPPVRVSRTPVMRNPGGFNNNRAPMRTQPRMNPGRMHR